MLPVARAGVMTETAYVRVAQALESAGSPRPANDKANWRCPAHDDGQASLAMSQGERGVLLHCHAGCSTDDVLAAIHLGKADLFDGPSERATNGSERAEIVATYDYVDEDAELLFQVVRTSPKGFRQRRRDDNGGWIWSLKDTRRVIYRLPRVIEAVKRGHIVFVVEGEKDVHALEAQGYTATCNPGGAGKWRDEYSRHFGEAVVVVVADKDEPGRKHARQVAASLEAVGADVQVLEPAEGKDVSDHLGAGFGAEQFVELAEEEDPSRQLQIISAAELVRRVEAAPPTQWLIKPLWPADAYGVLAAEQKAGKTWANLDLVVSVASGTPWMGIYDIERSGPVLCFLGEGGERKMKRRFDAICEPRETSLAALPIRLCFRVPHLTALLHMAEIANELEAHKPVLMVLDPLYLAARGAKGSQLYEMGEHLEAVQQLCQRWGTALVIVHHWNKTGEGKGAKRMTGVGPGEWGRVLVSVAVKEKRTDPVSKLTRAKLEWEFEGDEIPDTKLVVERRVWADDPDDLSSPLHYEVAEVAEEQGERADGEAWDGPTHCMAAVLRVLKEAHGTWFSKGELRSHLRARSLSYRDSTVGDAAERLALEGSVQVRTGPRRSRQFSAVVEGQNGADETLSTGQEGF